MQIRQRYGNGYAQPYPIQRSRRHLLFKDKADGVTIPCKGRSDGLELCKKTCKNQRLRYMGWLQQSKDPKPDRGWILFSTSKEARDWCSTSVPILLWPLNNGEIISLESPTSRSKTKPTGVEVVHLTPTKKIQTTVIGVDANAEYEVERCNCWAKRTPEQEKRSYQVRRVRFTAFGQTIEAYSDKTVL